MRLFSNVPLILLLVVTWPLVLLGLVVACEWLERRTFAPKAPGPPRPARLRRARPEQVEKLVLEGTAEVVARAWSAAGESPPAADHNNSLAPAELPVPRSSARPR
jgi:hypothetical protein